VQQKPGKAAKKFNVHKLKDRTVKQSFLDHLKQLDLQKNITPSDIHTTWVHIKDRIVLASEKHLGYLHPHKKDWISEDTWNMIELRSFGISVI
jgi:hypothetical protein